MMLPNLLLPTLSETKSIISCSVTSAFGCFTINAVGSSPASVSGAPTTPTSLTAGCGSISASSSEGGTCKKCINNNLYNYKNLNMYFFLFFE